MKTHLIPQSLRRTSAPSRLWGVALAGTALVLTGCGDREDRDVTASTETDRAEQVAANRSADQSATYAAASSPAATTGSTSAATAPGSTSTASTTQQNRNQSNAQEQDSATIALQEEQIEIQKQEQQAGGVLVRTDVETEKVERPVELKREEAEVVQLSAEEAKKLQQDGQQGAQQISEDEVFVPLTEEKAVVSKDVETTGGVRVTTNETTEEETVGATVRREVADVQRQDAGQSGQQAQGLEQRIRDDLRMAQDLNLSDEQIDAIDIQVQDNTVVLSGTVPSQQNAQQIEQRISDMQDVQSVENQLRPADQMQAAE